MATATLTACGQEDDRLGSPSNPVEEIQSAIGEATCATITPDVTSATLTATSPRTYDRTGCFKAFVVQALGYNGGEGRHPAVVYADTLPTTQAECERLYVAGYLYNQTNRLDAVSTRGVWTGGSCVAAVQLMISGSLMKLYPYRVVATARTDLTSSAPTRKVTVKTNLTVW